MTMSSDADELDERDKRAVAAIQRAFALNKANANSDTINGKRAVDSEGEAASVLQRKFRDKQQRKERAAGQSGASGLAAPVRSLTWRPIEIAHVSLPSAGTTAQANWTKGATLVKQLAGESGTGIHTDGPDPSERGLARASTRPKAALAGFKQNKNASLAERVKLAKEYAYNRDKQSGHRKAFGGGQKAVKVKKKLEEQHWLEMIDEKHRYGSNLKASCPVKACLGLM